MLLERRLSSLRMIVSAPFSITPLLWFLLRERWDANFDWLWIFYFLFCINLAGIGIASTLFFRKTALFLEFFGLKEPLFCFEDFSANPLEFFFWIFGSSLLKLSPDMLNSVPVMFS